jgi:hypothetical protein
MAVSEKRKAQPEFPTAPKIQPAEHEGEGMTASRMMKRDRGRMVPGMDFCKGTNSGGVLKHLRFPCVDSH